MDYKKLVKAAGYKGEQGDYIARKLEAKQIPATKIDQLLQYFPRTNSIAGVDLSELSRALFEAQQKLNEPPKTPPEAKAKEPKGTAVSVESEDK